MAPSATRKPPKTSEKPARADKQRRSFATIGPKPQEGKYSGHIDKLKEKLIAKAKVRKNYAKLLKKEGMSVDEPANRSGAMETDEPTQQQENEEEGMAIDSPRPSQNKGKARARAADFMDEDSGKISKRKSDCLSPEPEETASSIPSTSAQPFVHPSRRKKGKAPERVAKEPPKKKWKPTPDELEVIRAKRQADKQAWNRKTKKGQLNLNSRIGVMLKQIEKSHGKAT